MSSKLEELRVYLEQYVPSVVIDAFLLCIILVLCMLFVKYNLRILSCITRGLQKVNKVLSKFMGKFAKKANLNLYRTATLKRGKSVSKIYNFFDDMITDLDLHKDGVTVFGLIMFLVVITAIVTVIASVIFHLGKWTVPAFAAIFYVIFTMFRMVVGSQIARREAIIMDTIDLLVPDIRNGVYNAIVRYKDTSINPEIAGYFHEFVFNITNNGWTFTQAMQELNRSLGDSFTDFATKALLYEANRDDDTLEIFSATIDMNSNKRMLREENNYAFGQVRLAFWLCLLLIVGSAILFCLFDNAVGYVFMGTEIGRVLIVVDIFIVAHSLSRISLLQNGKL